MCFSLTVDALELVNSWRSHGKPSIQERTPPNPRIGHSLCILMRP
jgi:hypothetical protein